MNQRIRFIENIINTGINRCIVYLFNRSDRRYSFFIHYTSSFFHKLITSIHRHL